MGRRRTCHIAELIEDVNHRNRVSTCAPEVRDGWNALLESIMHAANVYAGWRHLNRREVPAGKLPGVEGDPGERRFPDESRRVYYCHRTLQ